MHLSVGAHHVVVDPLGGAEGERVANIVLRSLGERLEKGEPLGDAVAAVARGGVEYVEGDRSRLGAGCEIAAIHLAAMSVEIAWLGTIRVLRFHDGAIEQLTTDHSLAEKYRADGLDPCVTGLGVDPTACAHALLDEAGAEPARSSWFDLSSRTRLVVRAWPHRPSERPEGVSEPPLGPSYARQRSAALSQLI